MTFSLNQLRGRHLSGDTPGLYAVCSSHPMVLSVAMDLARDENQPLLVEATVNQVNLTGGYSGMTPVAFADYLVRLAQAAGFPADRLIIGADHLGPHCWRHLRADQAMEQTMDLAQHCILAGYRKIHLDTDGRCVDDPGPLSLETVVQRAATLCRACEQAARQHPDRPKLFYVIGRDVPLPGGDLNQDGRVSITNPDKLIDAIDLYKQVFHDAGLASAWERVMAVVVQPGVDFNDWRVAPYHPEMAAGLAAGHARLPGHMTFEVHATDYQTPGVLHEMVRDHFALLKVGPCLTFAFREAVYALAHVEDAWPGIRFPSHIRSVMEALMSAHPEHLSDQQQGLSEEHYFTRHFSYRDRIRYYWTRGEAMSSFNRLLQNLSRPLPKSLLRQFLPDLCPEIENGVLEPDPRLLIRRRIRHALEPYVLACRANRSHPADNQTR